MEMREEIELRLWAYIDGEGTPEERSLIERLIREQGEWKLLYGELLELHQGLDLSELEEPSMRFTRNVLETIAQTQIAPSAKQYINQKVVWAIGLFFIAMIFGFLVYGFAQIDWSAGSTGSGTFDIDLGKVNYSPLFSNTLFNAFMMLNVVAGLFFLDRLLARKRREFQDFRYPH